MGGLYVLLAVATMQVTYGWQSDGRGGVEYIVQIPPSEIDHVRHSGEITSVIHPDVRGHVSKIVIRVGTAELPRETPVDLPAMADRQTMTAPVIGVSDQNMTVMKPQTGAGMDLPSLAGVGSRVRDAASAGANSMANRAGNALNNMTSAAGNKARNAMDRATTGLANGARNTANSARDSLGQMGTNMKNATANATGNAANSLRDGLTGRTRTNTNVNPNVAPQFTGQNRDDWYKLPGQSQTAQSQTGQSQNGSSNRQQLQTRQPEFVGPPAPNSFNRNNSQFATKGNDTRLNQTATAGIGSTRNFGRPPNSNERSTHGTQQREGITYANGQLPLGRGQTDTRNTRTAQPDLADRLSGLGYSDRTNRLGSQNNVPARTIGTAPNETALGRNTINRNTLNQSRYENQAAAPQPKSQAREYDPQLTYAQALRLPPTGYSFDEYGNPINRKGEILDADGNPVSRQRAYQLTTGLDRVASTSLATAGLAIGVPGIRQPGAAIPPVNPYGNRTVTTGYPTNYPQGYMATSQYPNPASAVAPAQPPANNYAPRGYNTSNRTGSPSDRGGRPNEFETRDRESEQKKQNVAAQPLFNFLLLMSIAANIYLISRLLNLRNRFHDLVSSTRMATAPNTVAPSHASM